MNKIPIERKYELEKISKYRNIKNSNLTDEELAYCQLAQKMPYDEILELYNIWKSDSELFGNTSSLYPTIIKKYKVTRREANARFRDVYAVSLYRELRIRINPEQPKKIVVLGGSFNPPTIAHANILNMAKDYLDADLGLFVPSSDKYVNRKMAKLKESNIYSETDRFNMLKLMCEEQAGFSVSSVEFGDDGKGHTYDTLCKIQEKYPDAEIFFIIGADKINIINKWHDFNQLIDRFKIVVVSRNDNFDIKQNPFLSKYQDKFYFIKNREEFDDISSSAVRKMLSEGNVEILQKMVSPEVMSFLIK